MALGERIKACRQSAGMSQEKVAELVGVSRQAVTKWEVNRSAPNTENLFKLAEIFGTTVDMLLASEDENKQSTAEQIYCLDKMEKEHIAFGKNDKLNVELITNVIDKNDGTQRVSYIINKVIDYPKYKKKDPNQQLTIDL